MDLTLYVMAFILVLVTMKIIITRDYNDATKFSIGLIGGCGAVFFILIGLSYHVK